MRSFGTRILSNELFSHIAGFFFAARDTVQEFGQVFPHLRSLFGFIRRIDQLFIHWLGEVKKIALVIEFVVPAHDVSLLIQFYERPVAAAAFFAVDCRKE